MDLGLIITDRCNAACAHCSTSCGPDRRRALSREKILALMNDAAALRESPDEPLNFCFSGGEPLLDLPMLLAIVGHGRALGGRTSCVTNGYWAASDAKARSYVTALRDGGLNSLAVSTSRFHQQFVKASRVERALALAREVGLHTCLKCAITASDRGAGGLEEWARQVPVDVLEVFPVVPWLREGAALPEREYIRAPGLPEKRCPVPIITVREDGRAYTCCMPGAFTGLLALGHAGTDDLRKLRGVFRLGARQQILRDEGPIHFARKVIREGQGHRLRDAYAGVCDLCAHIASDPVLATIAERAANELENEQRELFRELRNATPA